MEEQKEEKYFHTENISKNIYTTVIGCVLMTVSSIAICMNWFFEFKQIPVTQVAIVFTAGFALLFMRDKISSYIDGFVKKKIDK
jgi:hypothetical protein